MRVDCGFSRVLEFSISTTVRGSGGPLVHSHKHQSFIKKRKNEKEASTFKCLKEPEASDLAMKKFQNIQFFNSFIVYVFFLAKFDYLQRRRFDCQCVYWIILSVKKLG